MTTDPATTASGSIWARPARLARGPVPEHSAAEIARAATSLADSRGLGAVTMRAVAAAIGAAPASLYRYVKTRSEVLELMADQAAGEYELDEPGTGEPVTDLLALGHQVLAVYRRHPWLLEIPPTVGLPGPNALAYMEHILAALSGTAMSRYRKLELIGLLGSTIRAFAQMQADQQRAGQDAAQWQELVASYLIQVAADGQHPHLAAVLSGPPEYDDALAQEPIFDRALTRVLTGLIPAEDSGRARHASARRQSRRFS
jgi:AcrR family transcriptional regulator